MTTLEEFSDVPMFTIKAVCAQTGIRAVTLRAWERRHEVLNPFRSENRYRLYSERDIAILRWIKSRVDSGMAISSVVNELRAMMRSGFSPEAVPAGPAVSQLPAGVKPDQHTSDLYHALRAHDEGRAGDVFREIQITYDLLTICHNILVPCLVEIGEDWYNGRISVTTEHFASAFVRGKLLTIYQAYPSHRNMPVILVGCAPSEQHEIGSLMASILLRSLGFRVEYLGPDIPLEDLVDYAGYEHPDMVILAASMESSALELSKINGKLAKLRPAPVFGFGGQAFVAHPGLKVGFPGIYLGDTLEQGMTAVQSLFPRNRIA
jgi:methanogenic corrinoid protein MtbC1/DNA-binding transcriptional MerR regulator